MEIFIRKPAGALFTRQKSILSSLTAEADLIQIGNLGKEH